MNPQMYRIAIRAKEPDRRKNATVWRYVVLATSLEEAKILAVAEWTDRPNAAYPSHRLEDIALVGGFAMDCPVYNCDIYGDKDKTEYPATIPTLEAVREAQARIAAIDVRRAEEMNAARAEEASRG